tara:strand:- start:299 stop:2734 length:2436 start_codon:yes stop_codon:yes gene_type:complete
MARAIYPLTNAREATVVSSNNTTYTVNILWTGAANVGANTMTLGKEAVQISYENPNQKDKNSYILTSTCTISYLVTSSADKTFVNSLSTSYEEKQVWITIREGSNMLWCGYMLLDLKDEQDVSYPYEVSFTAIDGIAGLKDIPFIRETNIDDSSVPSFPYEPADTFINAGYNNLLANAVGGTTTKYLSYLIAKTGMVLSTDLSGTSANFLVDYPIQTAVNYYNEGHPTPAADIDPLGYTKLRIQQLYKVEGEGYIGVPDCYTVLEYICKNFGMRCIYWQHTFHFVSLDEYNTDEDAAGTVANPINIPTRLYTNTGAVASPHTQNYLGSNSLSIYDLSIENATAAGEGLQKLEGAVYSGLPPIKTAKGLFFGFTPASGNVYRGFPRLPVFNSTGVESMLMNFPRVGGASGSGAWDWSTIQNAAGGDGIEFKAYASYKNTASAPLHIYNMFVLIARPSEQAGYPYKVCRRSGTTAANYTYVWDDWTSGTFPFAIDTSFSLKYAYKGNWVHTAPSINQNLGIKIYDTADDPYCTSNGTGTAGLFPTHGDFTGSWDFIPMSLTCWDSNSAYPMYGFSGAYSTINLGSGRSHGQATKQAGTTYYTGATALNYQATSAYQYHWNNTLENGVPKGVLTSVNSPDTVSTTSIEINVVNDNSFVYDGGDYFWGEGGTIEVSVDGSAYVAAGDGKWTNPTYAWNGSSFTYTIGSYDKTLVTLLLQDIIYNQSIPLKQLNGTTALAETNKYYSGTTTLKYMNPIGKLKDIDNKEYTLSTGTFSLLSDEWEVTSNEVIYDIPTATINIGSLVVVQREITVETP